MDMKLFYELAQVYGLEFEEGKMTEDDIKYFNVIPEEKLPKNTTKKQSITPLEELLRDFKGNSEDYKEDVDWGDPVGNEVW